MVNALIYTMLSIFFIMPIMHCAHNDLKKENEIKKIEVALWGVSSKQDLNVFLDQWGEGEEDYLADFIESNDALFERLTQGSLGITTGYILELNEGFRLREARLRNCFGSETTICPQGHSWFIENCPECIINKENVAKKVAVIYTAQKAITDLPYWVAKCTPFKNNDRKVAEEGLREEPARLCLAKKQSFVEEPDWDCQLSDDEGEETNSQAD